MEQSPSLVTGDPATALRDAIWTSIVATSMQPLFIRQHLFAYTFPGTADGSPDRVLIGELLPKLETALDALERAVADGDIGAADLHRADADLIPIPFCLCDMPESGPMLGERAKLTACLDRHLSRPSVASTVPPPLGKNAS